MLQSVAPSLSSLSLIQGCWRLLTDRMTWNACYEETNLKRIRKLAGLSQRELAELSGVSIRQLQLFEQRQRDINRTKAIDLVKLARVLGCKAEDLLQI